MYYPKIQKGIFLKRPNRFTAWVRMGEEEELCHVKNTGRLGELLIPGALVYVQDCGGERPRRTPRKTRYSLIAVEKEGALYNIDSQAPNRAVQEWLMEGNLLSGLNLLKPEAKYGASRFDFYGEAAGGRLFLEVKGVTLLEDGAARFPDAPTARGVKHMEELCRCVRDGYEAWLVFVIQAEGARYLEPNDRTHPAFGEALRRAEREGVHIMAVDCQVRPERMKIRGTVPVRLAKGKGDADEA